MHMDMDQMMDMIKGKSGDEFDKNFLKAMKDHHQGGIEMAKMARENAGHPELREMAAKQIEKDSQEISQMEEWEKQWGF